MKFYDCFVEGGTVSSAECFACFNDNKNGTKSQFASRVLCQRENAMELDMDKEDYLSPAEEETF